ncbi:hypothetical protein CRG98_048943, partial [Punica granatum]
MSTTSAMLGALAHVALALALTSVCSSLEEAPGGSTVLLQALSLPDAQPIK